MQKKLDTDEIIYDLENQIDFAETCRNEFINKMDNIISNLKELRHNQKYSDK